MADFLKYTVGTFGGAILGVVVWQAIFNSETTRIVYVCDASVRAQQIEDDRPRMRQGASAIADYLIAVVTFFSLPIIGASFGCMLASFF